MMLFRNPILPAPSADPWVIRKDGYYYFCFSTGNGISISKTKTITGVGNGDKRVVWTSPEKKMYSKEVWAPELHWLHNKWYIYFAADDGENGNHRMWVLEGISDDPLGSYVLKGKVTDAADKWAIDGTVLIKEDGSLYFIWSGWAGEENLVQNLYAAAMSDPWTLSSERVLISEPSYDWECQKCPDGPLVNEGPQVLKHDGTIHIVYSASHSLTEDYCLGLLTNKDGDVLNPKSWIKTPYPMFTKNNQAGVYAVGHASFTQSPDDSEHWILYHAMSDVKEGWDSRTTRAQKFMWDADGKPDFDKALSTQTLLKVPSGEV